MLHGRGGASVREARQLRPAICSIAGNIGGIKLSDWALNRHCKNIGGFKISGSVRGRPYVYMQVKYWRILIWRSQARPPNSQI